MSDPKTEYVPFNRPLARRIFEVTGVGVVRGNHVLWHDLEELVKTVRTGRLTTAEVSLGRDLAAVEFLDDVTARFRTDAGVSTARVRLMA